jgi:hypothetical protein
MALYELFDLLPAVQYGPWSIVKKRMRTVVSQLKRGKELDEVMTRDGMLDTADHPGMLVLAGIVHGSVTSFHCSIPWRKARADLFDLRTTPTSPAPGRAALVGAEQPALRPGQHGRAERVPQRPTRGTSVV